MGWQLGLDTGGTYTDAVLLDDEQRLVTKAKALTTHARLIEGLSEAVSRVFADGAGEISLVSLSTTLATNALVENRGRQVCLLLIGYTPAQLERADLGRALAGGPHALVAGGHRADGSELEPLDLVHLREVVERESAAVDAFAVSALFSVRNPAHELAARDAIRALTGLPVSLGHELSSALDAPRRALTTLLNARLIPMIGELLEAARTLMEQHRIDAPLMVVKGDGSLISASTAALTPVETILSGPAASVIGADFLCPSESAVVVDMGGTTTDIAWSGREGPRLESQGASVGGWRTMVRAIAVYTHGLGGDSAVRLIDRGRDISLGPERILPLARLALQHPDTVEVLRAQLDKPYLGTHAGRFVMAHRPARDADRLRMSRQQRWLWERILPAPIAIESLFEDQTMERALTRLIEEGLVLEAGVTPSDASHVAGHQQSGCMAAARLGIELMLRQCAPDLIQLESGVDALAALIRERVCRAAALAIASSAWPGGLADNQRVLLARAFDTDSDSTLQLQPRLRQPVIGIGAPASSYLERASQLLESAALIHEHADVANAIGAVVGSVRQHVTLLITAEGRTRVRLLAPDGPQLFDSLDEAASHATRQVEAKARQNAESAGAGEITVQSWRKDKVVEQAGETVFIESRISATATGRPGA